MDFNEHDWEAVRTGICIVRCCMEITSWPLQPNRTKLDCMRLAFVSLTPPLSAGSSHPEYPPFPPSSHLYNLVVIKSEAAWQTLGTCATKRLTKAVQTALYELIQADCAGAGGRTGVLQGPTDVLGAGTCIPSSLDQLGFPERERNDIGRVKPREDSGGPETSRAACGELMQVSLWGNAAPWHLISCARVYQTPFDIYTAFCGSPLEATLIFTNILSKKRKKGFSTLERSLKCSC